MLRNLTVSAAAAMFCWMNAFCQPVNPPILEPSRTVPVYKVTVVERSLQAVNYQYRSGPTEIDFKGTVLLPNSKGHATIESKRGRTDIEAKFEKLSPPTPFGRQYLTYVLWAISPEGSPHNLGEVVPNGSDSAHVHVTTDLQAFGLLVTAEPYSAVRQPSDVVVMENQIRPDTIGRIEPIQAKAELLSRGQFTYDKQAGMAATAVNTPKVSMDEYEQILEIYQAENALGIARAANAEQLAPNTFAKAEAAHQEAERLRASKAGMSFVVQAARLAAQTADDARMIAVRRAQEDRLASAQQRAARAQGEIDQAHAEAEQARAEAQRARAEADAAKARMDSERIARERAESEAAHAPQSQDLPIAPPPAPVNSPIVGRTPDRPPYSNGQAQVRMRLLERFNGITATRDTTRGLVVTLPDSSFDSAALRPGASETLARLTPIVTQQGLRVSVEGYSDSAGGSALAERRSQAVREALLRQGLNPAAVSTTNFADSRPLTSNATPTGRLENRRIEIVISGDAIGDRPLWDRSYNVTLR